MSPAQTFLVLVIAFALDFWSIGRNSIRDRIAFFMALAAFYVGFRNSSIAKSAIDTLNNITVESSKLLGDAYIAKGMAAAGLTVITVLLFIYTLLCLAPEKWTDRLGPYAKRSFQSKSRVNLQLWGCAFFLAILAEVPKGWFGSLIRLFVQLDVAIWSAVARTAFGIF